MAITARQREALGWLRRGLSHTQIASRMGIRHRETVCRLLRRARAKLLELVKFCRAARDCSFRQMLELI